MILAPQASNRCLMGADGATGRMTGIPNEPATKSAARARGVGKSEGRPLGLSALS